MLKAILFDLDDTLIDWNGFDEDWYTKESEHLRGVLDYINRDVHALNCTLDQLVRLFVSQVKDNWASARSTLRAPHTTRILQQTLIDLGVPPERLDIDRCMKAYKWGAIRGTIVFPDVPEILARFTARGLKLGLVTNAAQPMSLRDQELVEHGLMRFFPNCRFAAADVGYLKPHPIIFRAALNCLGVAPDEAIFIGDNPVADIAGAQAAGMKAVLRVKPPTRPLISGLVVPDAAINSLHDLLPVLDEWFPGWQD